MPIKLTEKAFFTEKLDASYPGLIGIDRTYEEQGAEAARKRFADFIRGDGLDTERFYAGRPVTPPTEAERQRGERILDGWVSSTGVPMHFPGRRVDWFANPTYNGYKEWPWQLSRHPEWNALAKLYRATGDERYAEAFSDYFTGWAEQTEIPEDGTSGFATLAWRTLEAGIRLAGNWPEAIMAFHASPSLSDEVIVDFFRSLWENAWRAKSCCTSHNWLITEMSGLATFGVLFPFLRDAAPYDAFAMEKLAEELDRQVYPDHFQHELTTGYHLVVIHSYLTAINIHRRMGKPVPEKLLRGVADLYLLFIQLMTPEGVTPDLNDGGRINVAEQSGKALQLFPDREEDFLFFSSGMTEGAPPDYTSIVMEYSGHTVLRSGWDRDALYAMLENAPFGKAHQHEDKLQVILHAYGKRLIDDPGTFLYDSSAMRKYILSTYSHSTALVDGMGQNRRDGYRWMPEDITLRAGTKYKLDADYEIVRGEYTDGYGSEKLAVRHERTLLYMKRGVGKTALPFWIVLDRFAPQDGGEHEYSLLWHLENVTAAAYRKTVVADYGDGVKLTLICEGENEILKGQKDPLYIGWKPIKTPGDHEHLPTPTVISRLRAASLATATVIFPTKNAECPVSQVTTDGDGTVRLTVLGETVVLRPDEMLGEAL